MALDPQLLKNMNKWAKDIAKDNDFHYVRYNTGPQAHECPICKKHKKGKYYGWNCIGFAWAVWHHGGGLGNKCSCDAIDNGSANRIAHASSNEEALKIARRRLGIKDIKVIRNHGADVPRSKWEPGDICLKFSGSNYTHTFYYYGDDYIVDSTSGSYIGDSKNIKKRHKASSYGARVLIRYVGNKKGDPNGPGTSSSSPSSSANTTTITTTTVKSNGVSKNASDVRKGAAAWAIKIANDNSFHYGHGKPAHHNGCYFCGTNTLTGGRAKTGIKDYKKTYCGNPFVHAAFAHGGGDTEMLRICRSGSSYDFHEGDGYDTSKLFEKLKPKPKKKDLLTGDVLCRDTHVAIYVGDGKIAEAKGEDDNKKNSDKWNDSIRVKKLSDEYYASFKRIYRYIGPGGGEMETPGQKTEEVSLDDGSAIVLKESIAKLYRSDNYKYANIAFDFEARKAEEQKTREKFGSLLSDVVASLTKENSEDKSNNAVPEHKVPAFSKTNFEKDKPKLVLKGKSTKLLTYPTLVEAPTIILDFDGIKIGGYNNKGDKYPNYIVSMSIKKVNGRINQYNISLSYQVRPGEDPNFIDKLLSRVGYEKPLKILYGDSNFPDRYYREESVIITDARQSEDISAYKINYTLTAVSSITAAQTSLNTFKPKTAKPSSVIYDLFYNSGEISRNLLDIFPGMRNKTLVSSKQLIPTNDDVVSIAGMDSASPFSYLTTLVASMRNPTKNSSYYLSFVDDSKNEFGGSYFKITEVESMNKNIPDSSVNLSYYELDINYPTDNFVMNFQLCNDNYWPMVYKYAGDIPAFQYGIDDNGNLIENKTNILSKSNKFRAPSLINDNWWKQVTEFPVSAKVTLKGLLNPVMLMSYVKINALFYGQEDMASGLYVVTQQDDTISGSGYTTELTLLRVSS